MKTFIGPVIVLFAALIVLGFAVSYHPAPVSIPVGVELMPPKTDNAIAVAPPMITSVPDTPLPPEDATIAPVSPQPAAPATSSPATPKPKKAKTPVGPPKPKPPLDPNIPQDFGRIALSFVGTDPDADAAWLDTINDPSVDSDARRELIEDLNETGFPDPKNLTQDDLPMIENRLDLIEQEGPFAIDDINAAAYLEAYKDLLDMENKLLSQ